MSADARRVLVVATEAGERAQGLIGAARTCGLEPVIAARASAFAREGSPEAAVLVPDSLDAAVDVIAAALAGRPVHGVAAIGADAPLVAAAAAEVLRLSWHPYAGVRAARNRILTLGRLLAAGLPAPWFVTLSSQATLADAADRLRFPCEVATPDPAAPRWRLRVETPGRFDAALAEARGRIAAQRSAAGTDPWAPHSAGDVLVEGIVAGPLLAMDGVLEHGVLRVLATYDRFEGSGNGLVETIDVTPSTLARDEQRRAAAVVAHAAAALGLRHGPVHAECRVSEQHVFVGGISPHYGPGVSAVPALLRFASRERAGVSLDELTLRHAVGEPLEEYGGEAAAAAVMVLTAGGEGAFRGVEGLDAAAAVPHVETLTVARAPRPALVILARAERGDAALAAVRASRGRLSFAAPAGA